MLNSTFEFISLAASNSHMVFCFFNLIIVILLLGTSKPNPQSNDQTSRVVPSIFNDEGTKKKSTMSCEKVNSTLVNTEDVSFVSMKMNNDDATSLDEEDNDDDLKRRVEEFIQKINKGWREEKMRSYFLNQWHVIQTRLLTPT